MIKTSCSEGELMCRGPIDEILTEYTIVTKMILRELHDMSNEEIAFKVLASLGQIAYKDYNKPFDAIELYNNVNEVITNEMEI